MKASDIMVSPVVTVRASTSVRDVAKLLLERRISGVPVVDEQNKVVGIISEGDLLHRAEAGTEHRRGWWLRLLVSTDQAADEYAKAHALTVADLMVRDVVTAAPDTPLHEIASLLERRGIKRIPIVRDGALVGIVTRSNLIQAVASAKPSVEISLTDTDLRDHLVEHLKQQGWGHTSLLNVTVNDGTVDIWGFARSDAERKAIRIAAEAMPGVRAVHDNMTTAMPHGWT
jgi:CBS domain-containing protein